MGEGEVERGSVCCDEEGAQPTLNHLHVLWVRENETAETSGRNDFLLQGSAFEMRLYSCCHLSRRTEYNKPFPFPNSYYF